MRRVLVPLLLATLAVSACAIQDPAAPGAPTSAGAPSTPDGTTRPGGTAAPDPGGVILPATPMRLYRGGGIAGRRESVTVARPGTWTREDRGRRTTGTLTAAERAALARLAADPHLAAEATRRPVSTTCADGYELSLTVGRTIVRWDECGPDSARPPVAGEIARLLLDSTG